MKQSQQQTAMVVSWIMMTAALLPAAASAVPCGEFVCQHGSTCDDGPPNFDEHQSFLNESLLYAQMQQGQGSHCNCPPRYTGIDCSIPYQSCGNGGHKCYFGGECFLGLEDVLGDEELFCDCSMAKDAQGNRHVGKFCEQTLTIGTETDVEPSVGSAITVRAGTSQQCRFPGDETIVCMFNGECNPDYPAASEDPCLCAPGFTGPTCEEHDADDASCTLPCRNGGTCKMGRPDPNVDKMAYDVYRQTNVETKFMWCGCPEGYYGDLCEMSSAACGDKLCFNNAQCIEWPGSNTTQAVHACSCQHSEYEEGSFAGKFCEYEATTYCPKTGHFEGDDFFCTNGGHCREDAWMGCKCQSGYGGFSCEYYVGTDEAAQSTLDCDLDCNGRGTCVTGLKSLEYLGDAAYAKHLSHQASSSQEFQHCVCKNGFTGLQCDHEVMQCGSNGEHFCLHGSTCILGDDDKYTCDCSTVSDTFATLFAGPHCEHPATSICESETSKEAEWAFCVNEGTCTNSHSPNNICRCPSDWEGPHCEVRVTRDEKIGHDMVFVARFFLVMGISLLAVAIFAVFTHHLQTKGGSSRLRRSSSYRKRRPRYQFMSHRPALIRTWGRRGKHHHLDADMNLSPHAEDPTLSSSYEDVLNTLPPPSEGEVSFISAPRTSPTKSAPLGEDDDDEYTRAIQTAGLVTIPTPPSDGDAHDGTPTLYMGPPRDEDGNELSNVEIL